MQRAGRSYGRGGGVGLKHLVFQVRPPIRIATVIIMSATLRAATFTNFFPGAAIHSIPGKTFGVDIGNVDNSMGSLQDYAVTAVQIVRHILLTHPDGGDILVFLPGKDDISKCRRGHYIRVPH